MNISQGSIATRVTCGEIFQYNCITNLLLSLTVKKNEKKFANRLTFGAEYSVLFF